MSLKKSSNFSYRCFCKNLAGRDLLGVTCRKCKTKVEHLKDMANKIQKAQGLKVYEFTSILDKAKIGNRTKIGNYCEINGIIGNNCSIQAFVFIPVGIEIQDNVFIGPGVVFTNDKHPPSGGNWDRTIVMEGAVIGGGAVILPGIVIGRNSVVGAGAVVTKNVSDYTTVVGNPARKL